MMHINQFWGYMQNLIYSCAIDHKRRNKTTFELLENCESIIDFNIDNIICAKRLIDKILSGISNPIYRQIIIEVLINGEKYEDTAKKLSISLSTVKSAIFRTRTMANANYKNEYNEIIN